MTNFKQTTRERAIEAYNRGWDVVIENGDTEHLYQNGENDDTFYKDIKDTAVFPYIPADYDGTDYRREYTHLDLTRDDLMALSNAILSTLDRLNECHRTMVSLDTDTAAITTKSREYRELHEKICNAMKNIDTEN